MKLIKNEMVGLIPAGGLGTRMLPFKVWKELINVGYRSIQRKGQSIVLPKVIAEYTLENMIHAGAKNFMIVLNDQKYEVFRFFGDGSLYDINIGYTCQNIHSLVTGMPIAIDTTYEWIKNKVVLMGMPDTIIEPNYSFSKLVQEFTDKQADLVLGIMPTNNPEKLAPVELDTDGEIKKIYDKPKITDIYNTWTSAVWSPRFTHLLHTYVAEAALIGSGNKQELLLSDVFTLAIKKGLKVQGIYFQEGAYYDMGDLNKFMETRFELETAVKKVSMN